MMMLPFQTGQASMIGSDQVNSAATVQAERSVVLNYLARAQTAEQLQSPGVDAQTAMDRVTAMSDDEITSLAGKITAAPAGADVGLALLVLVVFFIWYFALRR